MPTHFLSYLFLANCFQVFKANEGFSLGGVTFFSLVTFRNLLLKLNFRTRPFLRDMAIVMQLVD